MCNHADRQRWIYTHASKSLRDALSLRYEMSKSCGANCTLESKGRCCCCFCSFICQQNFSSRCLISKAIWQWRLGPLLHATCTTQKQRERHLLPLLFLLLLPSHFCVRASTTHCFYRNAAALGLSSKRALCCTRSFFPFLSLLLLAALPS